MKYWQKTFLCTLALFILALDVGAYLLFRAAYGASIEAERERGFAEHAFVSDTLTRDLQTVLARDNGRALVQKLYYSYAAYYQAQGLLLALSDGGGAYSNLPETPAAIHPEDGVMTAERVTVGDEPFLYVTGALGDTGYALVTARSVLPMQTRADGLAGTLVAGAALIGLVLAAALYFLLIGLTAPIRTLTAAARSIAAGEREARASVPGRDELAELAESFNRMADELTGRMRELSEEGERKQRLIDALAHELRTPLTAIGGYAQYLAEAAVTDDERLSALGYIERESVRLSELSEKLLLLTRLRTGAPETALTPLEEHLSDAVTACLGLAEGRGVTLTLEGGGAVWETDGQLLQMIVINLIQNGVRACGRGGAVRVTATDEALTVSDDGRGMDEETLRHITEPFFRADKARARAEGGAGLGLAIVQAASELLGLTLSFSSAPGAGTTVTLLQPRYNNETTSQQLPRKLNASKQKGAVSMKYSNKMMRSIWLPVAALVVILLGAMALYGCMAKSAALENDRVETQALTVSAAVLPSAETLGESAKADGYSVVDLTKPDDGESGDTPWPWPTDIGYQKAAQIAADGITHLFEDTLTGKTLYVRYNRYDGQAVDAASYWVYVGSESDEDCEYFAVLNAATGELTFLSNPSQAEPVSLKGDLDSPGNTAEMARADAVMESMSRDEETYVRQAVALIEEKYANGRMIETAMLNAVQWCFDADGQAQGDVWITMEEGPCYIVSILHPSRRVVHLDIYPLGKDSMRWGYKTEWELQQEAEERARTEEKLRERGAGTEAVPAAPTPTPRPIP